MSSLYKILKTVNEFDGNIVLSPYSLEKATDGFTYMFGNGKAPENVEISGLEEFNSWYGSDKEKWNETNRKAEKIFGENVKTVSFDEPEAVCKIVNDDCSEHTHGVIDKIITKGDLKLPKGNEMAGIILNTIFLAQKWLSKKEKIDNFLFNGTEIEGMSSEERVRFMNIKEGNLVSIPFEDSFSFYAFTPKKKKFELTKDIIEIALKRVSLWKYHLADLYMPNLAMSGEYTGTVIGKDLMYGKVKQLAKLMLTYKGVVAAAATMVLCPSGCSVEQEPKITIRLDKPFYFFIEKEGKVLFVGKMFEALHDQTVTTGVMKDILDEM